MVHPDRWATAFIGSLSKNAPSKNAEEGLVFLKELTHGLKPVSGLLFGHTAAAFIEKTVDELLREDTALQPQTDTSGIDITREYPLRFLCLLIEKNLFHHSDVIIETIEKMLDEKKGILNVLVEAASAEEVSENGLSGMIKERTGAAEVKMRITEVPELLAGYRLHIGGQYIDASLKGQLEQMTAYVIEEHEHVTI
jgi:F0F1-type ATP synthase delta subunit